MKSDQITTLLTGTVSEVTDRIKKNDYTNEEINQIVDVEAKEKNRKAIHTVLESRRVQSNVQASPAQTTDFADSKKALNAAINSVHDAADDMEAKADDVAQAGGIPPAMPFSERSWTGKALVVGKYIFVGGILMLAAVGGKSTIDSYRSRPINEEDDEA